MIYYRYYSNGVFVTVMALTTSGALEMVRTVKSARFARECMLVASWPVEPGVEPPADLATGSDAA